MNNYDDIKRFKEKLNMEGFDYKEIAENNPHKASKNWAIIKQVASADEPFHPLEQGLSTQPTPTPVSRKEFAMPDADKPAPVQLPRQDIRSAAHPSGLESAPAPAVGKIFPTSPLISALDKLLPAATDSGPSTDTPAAAGNTPDATGRDFNGAAVREPLFDTGRKTFSPVDVADIDTVPPDEKPANRNPPTQWQTGPAAALFGDPGRARPAIPELQRQAVPTAALFGDPGRAWPSAPGPRRQAAPFGESGHARPSAPEPWRQAGPMAAPFGESGRARPTAPSPNPPFAAGDEPEQPVRFDQLFSRKSRPADGTLSERDMPLSLLLENIALCR
ncbi:cellulose biosynthesis protein BcsO [Martelella alba]|nr:cellulose biosynthesis protein BcsO [Martelella alba]